MQEEEEIFSPCTGLPLSLSLALENIQIFTFTLTFIFSFACMQIFKFVLFWRALHLFFLGIPTLVWWMWVTFWLWLKGRGWGGQTPGSSGHLFVARFFWHFSKHFKNMRYCSGWSSWWITLKTTKKNMVNSNSFLFFTIFLTRGWECQDRQSQCSCRDFPKVMIMVTCESISWW